MSTLEVNTIEPESGTVITLGSSSHTVKIPGGGAGASKVLTSDATGGATWEASASATNTPSFGAYLAANQGLLNDTWTKITMNTEEWDTDSAFDHSTNYRFTVPADKAGKYSFSVTTTFDDTGGGQAVRHGWLALYKIPSGGSAAAFKQIKRDTDGSRATLLGQNLAAVVDLAVGDAIEFWALMNQNAASGVMIGGQENTFCSGYKLL